MSANGTYTFVYSAGETGATFTSNNQSESNSDATLTITFTSDCTVSFSYMVSSEAKYDKFTIQLGDETIANQISGTVDWTEVTRTVSAGTTLTLTYSKDGSSNSGSDTAAIKNLVVTASSAN